MSRPSRPVVFRVALALTAMLSIAACEAPPGSPLPDIPAQGGSAPATWQDDMLAALNAERANAGVGPLVTCNTLAWAAAMHSADQASNSTMSHTGSNGSTMTARAQGAGYMGWTNLGENVAAGYPSVSSVMSGWMGSTGHRANILSTSYTHVGLGKVASSNGTLYWTQDFGRNGSC